MGQKEIENEKKKEIAIEADATNEKDNHMIEILKKENEILKKQLESLNSGKEKNNYDTLLAMLEVLSMQRKKIYSIKKGKLLFF
jgi:hypothetical protein